MIKKLITTIALSAIVSGYSAVAYASDVTIGLVDTQTIIAKSSLYAALRKAQTELGAMEKNFEKDYMDRAAKLQQALQQKKSKEELMKLHKQYEGELRQKQTQAMQTLQGKQKNLEALKESLRKKVEVAIKDIAKQKKLTYVVDRSAMFYGGVDITNDVLKRIK